MKCNCGNVIHLAVYPAEEEWNLVKVSTITSIGVSLDEKPMESEEFFSTIDEESVYVLKCGNCDRLWLYDRTKNAYFSYIKEKYD